MENISFYKDVLNCQNEDEVFDYFLNNLKPSILFWSYFVNWEKVYNNTKEIEIALNIFNYLIGKNNFDEEFRQLIKQNPNIAEAIPALAVRSGNGRKKFKILVDYDKNKFVYEDYDFTKKNPDVSDIEKYLVFMEKTGLKNLITSQKIKNLVDYMIGVEAGIDSNGRKNRGGHAMEKVVEFFIQDLCRKKNINYLKEATPDEIKEKWGYEVPINKANKRFDFVVNSGKKLFIVEANFYGGDGSKIKSTAGEYKDLYDLIGVKYDFVWISDGEGLIKTKKSLREAFEQNKYLFNLDMVQKGALDFLISN